METKYKAIELAAKYFQATSNDCVSLARDITRLLDQVQTKAYKQALYDCGYGGEPFGKIEEVEEKLRKMSNE